MDSRKIDYEFSRGSKMNLAIVLSGGTGTRLGADIPKQYIEVAGKPIIAYCLEILEASPEIDEICVVAAPEWMDFVNERVKKAGITKFAGCAEGGESRQHSIKNGLEFFARTGVPSDSKVLIHDAARPNLSLELIKRCMDGLDNADGVLPALTVKDTVYYSEDGKKITSLLDRNCLFAGQAPESFRFGKYWSINKNLTVEELEKITGTSQIAFDSGFNIAIVDGDENNYKITTAVDLDKFKESKK